MSSYLTPLLQLQRFFIPGLLVLLAWATWRTVFRRDMAVGLALYLGLVIIVDGYLNTGIPLPGLEEGTIRYSEACALFLLMSRPPAPPRNSLRRVILFLVVLYFALLLVSALRAVPVLTGILDFRMIVIPQIVALTVAMRGVGPPEAFRRFPLCLTALAIIIGLFVFWDRFFDIWLFRSDRLFDPIYWMNRNQGRFGSVFLNPNYLGAFVVLLFPVAFVSTLTEGRPWVRIYGWIGLLALVFCLVETQSRAPMLAFGLALILLLFGPATSLSRRRRIGFLLVFVLVFAIFMPGFLKHATERFDSIENEVTFGSEQEDVALTRGRSRETAWLFSRQMITDHPFVGIGFGEQQFLRAMDDYGFSKEYAGEPLDNPHNSYLQIAVYAGIPALVAYVFANLLLIRGAVGVVRRRAEDGMVPTTFGLAVGVTGFLIVIFPDMHLFTRTVAPVYWAFFGLLLSLVTQEAGAKASSVARGVAAAEYEPRSPAASQ